MRSVMVVSSVDRSEVVAATGDVSEELLEHVGLHAPEVLAVADPVVTEIAERRREPELLDEPGAGGRGRADR